MQFRYRKHINFYVQRTYGMHQLIHIKNISFNHVYIKVYSMFFTGNKRTNAQTSFPVFATMSASLLPI